MSTESSNQETQDSNQIPKSEWKWLIGFNYFNLVDALMTILMTTRLGARELNPMMKFLLDISPLAFFTFKIAMGIGTAYYIIKHKKFYLSKVACILFASVVLWNLIALFFKLVHMSF